MTNRFVGTWRLISVEDSHADGTVTYPYGRGAVGLLIYDSAGNMAVQIMSRDRKALSSDRPEECSAEEVREAVEGFTAFFGVYEVDEAEKRIIHRVEGHLLPNSVGKALSRSFELDGNSLTLRPSQTRRVIWERIA